MQQLILAAGKGTRLNVNETNKCFVKINGKTLLDYNLELSEEINATKIIMIIGHNGQYIRDYLSDNYKGIPVKYIIQEPQLGIAHAVKTAIPELTSDFFMCLSDELLIQPRAGEMLKFFRSECADCVCGMTADRAENIKKAYTMDFGCDKVISRIKEKPNTPFNGYKGTGYCMMSRSMFEPLEQLTPNPIRNEYEMGDWMQLAIDIGLKCMAFEFASKNFNINELDDIELAARAIEEVNK